MKPLLILVAWLLAVAVALAAPVPDAMNRSAAVAREPHRAVLLAAGQAGARLVAVGERGIVVGSQDGGKSWRQAQVPVAVTLTAVRFADATHGFATGHGGTVLASEDAGGTWHKRLDGVQAARIALQQAQADGDDVAIGQAKRLVADGADKPFLDLHVFDARRVLVIGAYNLAFYTEDAGATWQSWMSRPENPKNLHLYTLRARGNTLLIAGEQGLVLRSHDAGKTFQRVVTPYKGSFFTGELLSANEMLLAGMRGNVWRSEDGGAGWKQLVLPDGASVTGSVLQGAKVVVLATQGGQLLRAEGNKVTLWGGPALKPLPPLNGLLASDAGHLLVVSNRGVMTVADDTGVGK